MARFITPLFVALLTDLALLLEITFVIDLDTTIVCNGVEQKILTTKLKRFSKSTNNLSLCAVLRVDRRAGRLQNYKLCV